MFKINLGKIYPVSQTDTHQVRVFINDESYKPTAPIGTIVKDMSKTTHRYTFTSKGGKKIWSGNITTLKNTILERYIQAIRTQPTTEEFNNLSDEIYYNESLDDIMQDEGANAILDNSNPAEVPDIFTVSDEQGQPLKVTTARDNTLCLAC